MKYLLNLVGEARTVNRVVWRTLRTVYYITFADIYLDFDGLTLAPVRSTKFKPKESKNCLKKILITIKIFLKKIKITMYTHANLSFSEKNETACKKK